jgi:Restriction endonuclease fold toxin 7
MAATSSPLTWYSAYRMWTDLRFDVPDEPGDISKGIVFAGSMLVPGPEGKGAAAKQLAVNAAKGRNFQKLVRAAIGAVGIFQRSKVFKGGSIFRRTIPDALSDIALVEIKNVAELGYTPQLGAQIYAAAASNRTYVLVINMETKVYKPLVETIEAFNGFIVRFNPETRTFHPF